MKITKTQLRKIIKEEKWKLHELGIDRTAREMALDDPNDLTIGVEQYEKIVNHLQAINDIIESDNNRGGGSIDHHLGRSLKKVSISLTARPVSFLYSKMIGKSRAIPVIARVMHLRLPLET